jgi:protein-arginine kinase activator protein McsA
LIEFRESLREKHAISRTLAEQLSDAIAAEDYELAADLRDRLARREKKDRDQ